VKKTFDVYRFHQLPRDPQNENRKWSIVMWRGNEVKIILSIAVLGGIITGASLALSF